MSVLECLCFHLRLFKFYFFTPRGGVVLCRPVRVCVCECVCVCVLIVHAPQVRHAQPVWKSLARPWGKTLGVAWWAQGGWR